MRELWKAYGLVIANPSLRATVSSKARVVKRDDLNNILVQGASPAARIAAGSLAPQPDVNALGQIDTIFRGQSIHMSVYELAEINRWFVVDQPTGGGPAGQFSAALEAMRQLLLNAPGANFDLTSTPFLQCIGVLVADPRLRADLAGTGSLTAHNLDPAGKEPQLRQFFNPGSAGDHAADTIFSMGWTSGGCLAPLLVYQQYLHSNR